MSGLVGGQTVLRRDTCHLLPGLKRLHEDGSASIDKGRAAPVHSRDAASLPRTARHSARLGHLKPMPSARTSGEGRGRGKGGDLVVEFNVVPERCSEGTLLEDNARVLGHVKGDDLRGELHGGGTLRLGKWIESR